ncbi:MAG: phosphotransferase [Synechococcaceae cyanobacterium SM2_3_1]|nr:phosphotransferase [Synechococcaceae cyanobacterium SM2_3_1]
MNLRILQSQLQDHLFRHGRSETLHLLAHGEANLIFRLGEDRLVRVAMGTPNRRFQSDPVRVSAFEARILKYLAGTDISHHLYYSHLLPSPDFLYTYLITSYLEGRHLDYSRVQLQACAQTLAQLHRLPLQGHTLNQLTPPLVRVQEPLSLFYQEAQSYAQSYLDFAEGDAEVKALLCAVLAMAESFLPKEPLLHHYPYLCLVHSDHTYDNWIINRHHAHLIDWEWAEVGTPAGDLGHFLSPVTLTRWHNYTMPTEDRDYFLNSYFTALEDPQLAEIIHLHMGVFGFFPALRSLCWTPAQWIREDHWYEQSQDQHASTQLRQQRREEGKRRFGELGIATLQLAAALREAL